MTYNLVYYVRQEVNNMATKLTLRLDETVISKAKRAARIRGVSLSQMVSGYFQAISNGKKKTEASPVLAEISGVISQKADTKKLKGGYRKHIKEKYR
jgi:Family of unknown function (DUF6364)